MASRPRNKMRESLEQLSRDCLGDSLTKHTTQLAGLAVATWAGCFALEDPGLTIPI